MTSAPANPSGHRLAVTACQQGIPARYFTTSSLVAGLRRAKDAGRLDNQLAALAKNRLLVIGPLSAGGLAIGPASFVRRGMAAAGDAHWSEIRSVSSFVEVCPLFLHLYITSAASYTYNVKL